MEEIVWREGDLLIIRSDALFGSGFNVYRLDSSGRTAEKVNPASQWFTTLDAARNFAAKL